jgi:hypothetical protein
VALRYLKDLAKTASPRTAQSLSSEAWGVVAEGHVKGIKEKYETISESTGTSFGAGVLLLFYRMASFFFAPFFYRGSTKVNQMSDLCPAHLVELRRNGASKPTFQVTQFLAKMMNVVQSLPFKSVKDIFRPLQRSTPNAPLEGIELSTSACNSPHIEIRSFLRAEYSYDPKASQQLPDGA